jgi:hypothetical protein
MLFLQDLTFPQGLCWGFWSSGMLCCVAGNLTYQNIVKALWSFKMLGNMQSTTVTSQKTYSFCHTTMRSSNKVRCLPQCLKFHKPLHCSIYKGYWKLLYWTHTSIPGQYYFIQNQHANWVHTPMTQQRIGKRASVTTVVPTAASKKSWRQVKIITGRYFTVWVNKRLGYLVILIKQKKIAQLLSKGYHSMVAS